MTRFELGGYGDPIPSIAIPDPNLSGDRPVQLLVLEDGVPFVKTDWMALGYTHYEVWCIGGAGGLGGPIGSPFVPTEFGQEPAPDYVWNIRHEHMLMWDLDANPPQNYDAVSWQYNYTEPGNPNYPPGGVPGNDYGWPHSHRQWEEHWNPGHVMTYVIYHMPFLVDRDAAIAGAGGGGGLQVANGKLEDLPDSCAVVVGQAGADAPPGQIAVNGPQPYDPVKGVDPTIDMSRPADYSTWNTRYYRHRQLTNLTVGWTDRWGGGAKPTFYPPASGGSGGASSFGGNICQASGGVGGHPSVVWSGGLLYLDGAGGAGGIGGQTTPGGGAAGSTGPSGGADGSWDGHIGAGGGGGRGGAYTPVRNYGQVSSGG
jgi:hypothetical protein